MYFQGICAKRTLWFKFPVQARSLPRMGCSDAVALEKNISGEVPALWKSPIYASFILNGLCNVDVIARQAGG